MTFHRAVEGITQNETLEVVRAEGKRVVARNDPVEERTLTAKQSKSFEVYEQRGIEIASGDKLLLAANRRDSDFFATNGEIVTVSRVDKDGRIRLEDGPRLRKTTNGSLTDTPLPHTAARATWWIPSSFPATGCRKSCFMSLHHAAGGACRLSP